MLLPLKYLFIVYLCYHYLFKFAFGDCFCRQPSAALNVWQPEVIRGRQKQLVEQCVVPAESRIHALEMELRLCRQQIMNLKKSHVSVIFPLTIMLITIED